MKAKRRRHDPEFKARVALEALKGVKSIQQIAKDYQFHPVQVSEWKKTMWKKTMTEAATGVFGPGKSKTEGEDFEQERSALHFRIGQLTVEVDFLRKNQDSPVCEGSHPAGGQKSSPTQCAQTM
jgi:transposase/putative transposase